MSEQSGRRVRDLFLENQIRYADFPINARRVERRKGADEEKRATLEVAVSSEAEIMRWFGIEVLGHSKSEVDMTRLERGASVLVDHRGNQVGVVEGGAAHVDNDRVLGADIRLSSGARGQEIKRDVEDVTG